MLKLSDLQPALDEVQRVIEDNRNDRDPHDQRWRFIGIWGNLTHAEEHIRKLMGFLRSDDDDLSHAACRLLMALQLALEEKQRQQNDHA